MLKVNGIPSANGERIGADWTFAIGDQLQVPGEDGVSVLNAVVEKAARKKGLSQMLTIRIGSVIASSFYDPEHKIDPYAVLKPGQVVICKMNYSPNNVRLEVITE